MENYIKLNRLLAWLVFLIATLVYFLTLEPTASWWDCGEYIATAYKLQVGHPPGAPLFQLLGRFFSLFAFGDTANVAMMVNVMSALSSSFTILFLFWTITMLGRKLVPQDKELSKANMYAILGSGLVGSLAFAFSDSFWFSAGEGEVYAMSSFFTAITFWAILRWERVADEKHADRWIILIAFLVGLSIGVHMLNLLAIPAIAFVYYFKKYKASTKGAIITFVVSMILLSIIMFAIIPGIVSLSTEFELFFINTIGLPFNSGTIIYFGVLIGLIIGVYFMTVTYKKALLNTAVLSFVFILIGYSSFFLLIIRSNENTPINENSPEDAISLLSYLNREQYGSWPKMYGQYYTAPVAKDNNGQSIYKDGNPQYIRDKKAGKYVITDHRAGTIPVYDKRFTTIFPRMWSAQKPEHKRMYNQYATNARTIQVNGESRKRPSFGDNLGFFFDYQIGHMYLRYFMWNFVGRQNDIEAQPGPKNGNWLSGVGFIDDIRLGSQDKLPESMQNPAHNKFYFLPLILGLIGLFFHLNTSKRDTLVVALLFFMTGIAIVLYLNQYPYQPRERDYAYTGSYYAFAIWIGLGVMGIYSGLKKYMGDNKMIPAGITFAALLLVPGIMAQQGWDDHNRSGRYAARDFGMNYLAGCDPNAILITNGDNDTFPLWYVQEVEGFRTDVRVVNYMLSSGYWYVHQLGKKVYDSEPLKFTLSPDQYEKGKNQYIMYVDRGVKHHVEVKELIDFIANEDDRTKLPLITGERVNYMPVKKLRLTVDSAKCVENGIVPPEMAHLIVPYIEWEVRQKALYKNDLMLLDFLANNNWERPMYFANPNSLEKLLDIDEYCHLEGSVYKFMPVKAKDYIPGLGGVHADRSYDVYMNDFSWGNLNDPSVTVDRESYRHARILKQNFLRVAQALLNEGKPDKAVAVLDSCLYYFPYDKIHYDIIMMPYIEIYYNAGRTETANEEVKIMMDVCDQELAYFLRLDFEFADKYYSKEIQQDIAILQRMAEVTRDNGQDELADKVENILLKHMKVLQ
ncbi:MAG: DUF2723 domain-containing protein [Bacteroidales bacterium]|nr:DUF2723 domain-containing protein [Bacteroidales bacterium]